MKDSNDIPSDSELHEAEGGILPLVAVIAAVGVLPVIADDFRNAKTNENTLAKLEAADLLQKKIDVISEIKKDVNW